MGTLDTKWMGKEISNDVGVIAKDAFALAPGQVMMIFSILFTSLGIALVILGIEKLSFRSALYQIHNVDCK